MPAAFRRLRDRSALVSRGEQPRESGGAAQPSAGHARHGRLGGPRTIRADRRSGQGESRNCALRYCLIPIMHERVLRTQLAQELNSDYAALMEDLRYARKEFADSSPELNRELISMLQGFGKPHKAMNERRSEIT